jgi:conjugative transfer pilus assembly protein TraH
MPVRQASRWRRPCRHGRRARQPVLQDHRQQPGRLLDWASSEQGCGTGGSQSSTIKGNSDSTMAGPYNYTWSMLSQKYPSFDTDLQTVPDEPCRHGDLPARHQRHPRPTFKFLGQGDPALITALLDGGNSASVYACDTTDKCLNPTQTSLSVSTSNALKTRVYNLLIDIAGASRATSN